METSISESARRQLKMHPKLLLDVIKRQAGTLEKAILEGCMNAVEAGATKVDILFNDHDAKPNEPGAVLTINDEGQGISSIEEIETFWETFGQPHSESENKIWAQFRMGRGQLFSFGKNTWLTSAFKMVADVQHWGLQYELHTDVPMVNGCNIRIQLYRNPIGTFGYASVDVLKQKILKLVEFMPIPIHFNGEQLSTPADKCKWTFETDDAYYLFNIGTDVKIYNLGAYVMSLPASQAGTVGTIVSKRQLKINFARNDIQSDCEIWGRIQEVIKENRIKKARKPRTLLEDHERQAILSDLRDCVVTYDEVQNLGLLRTTSGKVMSLSAFRRENTVWTFGPKDSRIADKLIQSGSAICLDENILSELGYKGDPADFFSWLLIRSHDMSYTISSRWRQISKLYRSFDELSENYNEFYKIVATKQLTMKERRIAKVLGSYSCWEGRVIVIGESDSADAWTDGQSYIALARSFIKRFALSSPCGIAELFAVLVHELAHDENTAGTHVHGEAFYRRFHDIVVQSYSPMRLINSFAGAIKDSKLIERQEQREAKEAREARKRDEALGISS